MTKLLLFSKNVPLYNDYQNPIRFKTIEERSTFFAKYDLRYKNVEFWKNLSSRNITYGNGLNMSVIIPLDSGVGYPENVEGLPQKLEPNYLCVREIYGDGTSQESIDKFYFINNLSLVNSKAIRVDCELDVMTTFLYGIHYKINGKVFAERKHCDRFIKKENKYYYRIDDILLNEDFETSMTPDILENEKILTCKYPQLDDYTNLFLKDKKFMVIISTMPLAPNVEETKRSALYVSNGNNAQTSDSNISTNLYYSIIPLFATYDESGNVYGSELNVEYWVKTYNENSNIINACIIPYFLLQTISQTDFAYNMTDKKCIVKSTLSNNELLYIKENNHYMIELHRLYNTELESINYTLLNEIDSTDFNTLVDRDNKYEPKLQRTPYKMLILHANETQFSYDKMLLNSKEINVKTCVIPLPNKVGGFTYVNITDFTTFVSPYKNSKYMGFGCVNNINRNINILNNKWQEYITANKNFEKLYQVSMLSASTNAITGIGLTASGLATGNPLAISQGGSMGVSGISSLITNTANYIFNNDNIKSQPDTVKTLKDDAYLSQLLYDNEQPRIFEYKINDLMVNKVSDFFFNFGYKYNQDIYFAEFFNRQRFNYIKINDDIKCKLEAVMYDGDEYQMNANIIKKLNSIFNNGCTLWNVCEEEFNTEYENWEVSLSE